MSGVLDVSNGLLIFICIVCILIPIFFFIALHDKRSSFRYMPAVSVITSWSNWMALLVAELMAPMAIVSIAHSMRILDNYSRYSFYHGDSAAGLSITWFLFGMILVVVGVVSLGISICFEDKTSKQPS